MDVIHICIFFSDFYYFASKIFQKYRKTVNFIVSHLYVIFTVFIVFLFVCYDVLFDTMTITCST